MAQFYTLVDSESNSVLVNTEKHHLFPQQFRGQFADQGINIDDFAVEIPADLHQSLHYGNGGGVWNADWRGFLMDEPSREEMMQFKDTMIEKYGLGGYPIVKY